MVFVRGIPASQNNQISL